MGDTSEVKNESGTSKRTVWMCGDIKLGHAISQFDDKISFASGSTASVVRMHFGLKGDYHFTYKQVGRSFDLIGGHHNVMFSSGFDMVVENKTSGIETFGVQFPVDQFLLFADHSTDSLKRFCENIVLRKSVMLSEAWGAISPEIQQVIQQIIHHQYAGDIEQKFLLSKSIELLVLCCDSYEKTPIAPFIKSKADKEKIIAVRDLINERAHRPPNLSEIARMVGLNEYKLKRGFKETFETTVFGYLTDQRLNLAKRYLQDTSRTAAEISEELGYTTPQYFNNAFKRKFGTTPDAVRK